ncbi:outer membrane protein TOM13-domain-containing protein [Gilbertella persicaria]|uniref:outer membrane protein TOM13-domain-containing protein n=1 Tax=Gilbertella persicaria TaxID=101096 RepID=UPI00221E647C|nr:outer membrane protein TOM13-domain-containing protein [Gilbertella persicaria]KAI8076673.1 outer membrane protein TOM13-domain-containing protein [Gilbertella persicaria]
MSDNNSTTLVRREPWYRHPLLLWALKSTAINFVLPFFNGVMLGFGEILANELVFKYGWFGYTRPQLGVYGGIPATCTSEYKKTIEGRIKHEQKEQQKELLLVD